MAWYDHIGKALGGLVDTMEFAPEAIIDIGKATADLPNSGFGGFLANSWGAIQYRTLQQGLGGLETSISEPYQYVPNAIRGPIHSGVATAYDHTLSPVLGEASNDQVESSKDQFFSHGILGFLNAAKREGVSEPLSTAFTVGSLSDSKAWEAQGGTQGIAGLFSANNWSRAYDIAQTRSPGQALVDAVATKDILDQSEMTKVQASDWYPIVSGALDAAATWYLAPDQLAIKGFGLARTAGLLGQTGAVNAAITDAQDGLSEVMKTRDRLSKGIDAANATEAPVAGVAAEATTAATDAAQTAAATGQPLAGVAPSPVAASNNATKLALDDPDLAHINESSRAAMDEINRIADEARARLDSTKLGATEPNYVAPSNNRGSLAAKEAVDGVVADGKMTPAGGEQLKGLLDQIHGKYLDDVDVHFTGHDGAPDNIKDFAGAFSFDKAIVHVFTDIDHMEAVDRTAIHEIFHALSNYLPDHELLPFEQAFTEARKGFLETHPWAADKVVDAGGATMRPNWFSPEVTWTPQEVEQLVKAHGADEIRSVIHQTSDGTYALNPTSDIYRLATTDEFFAERMKDEFLGRATQGAQDQSFMDRAKGILASIISKVGEKLGMGRGGNAGGDPAKLLDGFFAGKFDAAATGQTLSSRAHDLGYADSMSQLDQLPKDYAIETEASKVNAHGGGPSDAVEAPPPGPNANPYLPREELATKQAGDPVQVINPTGMGPRRMSATFDHVDEATGKVVIRAKDGNLLKVDPGNVLKDLTEGAPNINPNDPEITRFTKDLLQGHKEGLINNDEFAATQGLIDSMGSEYFRRLKLQFDPSTFSTPAGSYSFGEGLIRIFDQTIGQGNFTRTIFHEMFHHLSKYVPAEVLAEYNDEFKLARNSFLDDNPGLRDLLGDKQSWLPRDGATFTPEQIKAIAGQGADTKNLFTVTDDGKYALRINKDTYLLTNLDEYFAETMSRYAQGQQVIENPGRFQSIAYSMLAWMREHLRFYADKVGNSNLFDASMEGPQSGMAGQVYQDLKNKEYHIGETPVVSNTRPIQTGFNGAANSGSIAAMPTGAVSDTAELATDAVKSKFSDLRNRMSQDHMEGDLPSANRLTNGENELGIGDQLRNFYDKMRHGSLEEAYRASDEDLQKASARLTMARANWDMIAKPKFVDEVMRINNSEVPVAWSRQMQAGAAAADGSTLAERARAAVLAEPIESYGFPAVTELSDAGKADLAAVAPGIKPVYANRLTAMAQDDLVAEASTLNDSMRDTKSALDDLYAQKATASVKKKIGVLNTKMDQLVDQSNAVDWMKSQKTVATNPFFEIKAGDTVEEMTAARNAAADAAAERFAKMSDGLESADGQFQATMAWRTERLRQRFFPKMADGELPASWLALAQNSEEAGLITSMIHGDMSALKDLAATNPGVSHMMEDVMKRRLMTRSFDLSDMHSSTIAMEHAFADPASWISNGWGDEMGDAVAKGVDLEHGGEDIVRSEIARIRTLLDGHLDATKMGALKYDLKYSAVWRSDKNPLHLLFDQTAAPVLNFDDPAYLTKLQRHYRDAGMTDEQQQYWLGRIGGLQGDARYGALQESIDDAIGSLASKHNLDGNTEVIDAVRKQISQGRLAAKDMLLASDKKYGGYSDVLGENWSHVRIEPPGSGAFSLMLPLTPEQLAGSEVMPNFRSIDKALGKMGGFMDSHPGAEWTGNMVNGLMDQVNHLWKPTVLLRPAWPLRVVLDEQLRMASVLGSMRTLAQLPRNLDTMGMDFMRKTFPLRDEDGNALFMAVDDEGKLIQRSAEAGWQPNAAPIADVRKATVGMGIGSSLIGAAVAGGPGAVAGGLGGAILGFKGAERANGLMQLRLTNLANDVIFDRYHIASSIGAPGDRANLYENEISAQKMKNNLISKTTVENYGERKFDPMRSHMYMPDEPMYEHFWNEVVNKQFGNSNFSRRLWDKNQSNDDIVDWLMARGDHAGDSSGPRTLMNMPKPWQDDPELWVSRARGYLHGNVMPAAIDELDPFAERLAAGGKVNYQEVRRALTDAGYEPSKVLSSVHGQDVMEIHGSSNFAMKAIDKGVDRVFDALGSIPTDNLTRHPYFDAIYQDRVKSEISRRIAENDGQPVEIAAGEMAAIQDQARRIGLNAVRTTMHDLTSSSRLAEAVGQFIPFFPMQQQVLTRWAGLAMRNPSYFAHLQTLYNAPQEAGWTGTDANGNSYTRIQIPDWARGLINKGIFRSAVDDQGYISFDPNQLNVLDMKVGAGPIVNIAVAEAARHNPSLEDHLGFMYPYGLPSGVLDSIAPAWFKRVYASGAEDRSFGSVERGVAITQLVKMQLSGERTDFTDPEMAQKFYDDVHSQAKSLFALRTAAGLLSPVALQFKSPYQDFIDEFRKMKIEDPANAEQRFLAEHGEAYFALTQSFSKTLDGVPATLKGEQARDKYKSLVETYPEFGGLIIGEEGAGAGAKFSSLIYKQQTTEHISTGDPRIRREQIPLQDVVTGPDVRLGWQKFSNFQDWLTNQMAQRRVTSLSQKNAADLAQAKADFVNNLAAAHPSWYAQYLNNDQGAWLKKVKAFTAIANSEAPGLSERPDIVGLRQYLDGRQRIANQLATLQAAEKPASLTAKSNTSLANSWDVFQNQLVESNPQFGALWSRWLQNDLIPSNSWRV